MDKSVSWLICKHAMLTIWMDVYGYMDTMWMEIYECDKEGVTRLSKYKCLSLCMPNITIPPTCMMYVSKLIFINIQLNNVTSIS